MNKIMEMYDNPDTVERSFDLNYISEYLIQAQWAEFIELKKVITELANKKKAPISILDIGIGNGRVAMHLAGIREIWGNIALYDGTDNAEACVEITKKNMAALNLHNKVSAYFIDAKKLGDWQKKYDLVITTWFTAGNFYPDDFPFETYKDSDQRLSLDTNKNFTAIFSNAYNLLLDGGEVVIGACYKDNEETRKKQEASYLKMGMNIITNPADSFTATKERFWSQRFTKSKLISYLSFVKPEKISFTNLDTYEYAMQVRIKK
jgi:SAM-dependent methyltransferase